VGKCLDSHLKGAERSEPLKHRFFHEDKEVYIAFKSYERGEIGGLDVRVRVYPG